MKNFLILVVVSISIYAHTITSDNGYQFSGYCEGTSKGSFDGFYDSSNSYGQVCAGGECIKGNYSKSYLINKACE